MEARKPFDQAVDARTAEARLKSPKPQRVRLRSLAARAACWLLTTAALLTLPVQTQAQTIIWSSTLTVKMIADNTFGCNMFVVASCSDRLSDEDFTYNRTTYKVVAVHTSPPDALRITIDKDIRTALQNLTLNISNMNFAFANATNPDLNSKLWSNAGLTWATGDTITLTLTDPDGTPGAPETPAAPAVGATEGSTTSLDVGWLEPANAEPFVKYHLRYRTYRERGGGAIGFWDNGPQDINIKFATITGLDADSGYHVQVLASNNNGDSEWSPSGIGRTDSGEAPGAPTNLTATANGEDRIDLSWTAPSYDGGIVDEIQDRIRSYKIEVQSRTSNWLVLVRTIGSTDTEYSHRDVPAGVSRCYRVSATNTAGTGPPSNNAVATTDSTEGRCGLPPPPDPQMQQSQTPLTASFASVPPAHDGETPFWLELTFDAPVAQGSKPQLQALLDVTGGAETRFRRKNGQLDHWRIQIDPTSDNAVTVMLAPSPPCGESSAVCTDDGRTFTTGLATQIHGPASGNNNWSDDSVETAVTPVPALPVVGVGLLGLLLALLGSRACSALVR